VKRAEFLKTVRKEIHYIFARNAIEKELEEHINESIEDLLAEGLSFDEAEAQAVLQMGDAKEIGRELNKAHNPLMGYLITLTRCVLVLMIYPVLISLNVGGHSLAYMAFPIQREYDGAKQELNLVLDTPVHYVKFDDLYFLENGECSITYRTYLKFWESRAHTSFDHKFTDQYGNEIMTAGFNGTAGILVARTEIKFMKDDMDSIFIHSKDGQVLEISLEVDDYETK